MILKVFSNPNNSLIPLAPFLCFSHHFIDGILTAAPPHLWLGIFNPCIHFLHSVGKHWSRWQWSLVLLSTAFFIFFLWSCFGNEGLGTSASAQNWRLKPATISPPEGKSGIKHTEIWKIFLFSWCFSWFEECTHPIPCSAETLCHFKDDFHRSLQSLWMSWDYQGCSSPSGKAGM